MPGLPHFRRRRGVAQGGDSLPHPHRVSHTSHRGDVARVCGVVAEFAPQVPDGRRRGARCQPRVCRERFREPDVGSVRFPAGLRALPGCRILCGSTRSGRRRCVPHGRRHRCSALRSDAVARPQVPRLRWPIAGRGAGRRAHCEVSVLDQARDVGRHAGGAHGRDFDHRPGVGSLKHHAVAEIHCFVLAGVWAIEDEVTATHLR